MERLLFLVNVDWFFISHRLPIAQAALKQGYEVHIATRITDKKATLESQGLIVHDLPIARGKSGLIKEIATLIQLVRILRDVRPSILHTVTIKPVLYGGIAARFAGVKCVVVAISGLGYLFTTHKPSIRLKRKLIGWLYRSALKQQYIKVIFQNHDDKKILTKLVELGKNKVVVIPGSGIDLEKFVAISEPKNEYIKVVMASRLLTDKGVNEFVNAARQLQHKGITATCQLAGSVDPGNPASITQDQIETWKQEGVVELLGQCGDMTTLFSQAHIVALPSYREGFPKVLIEAAACGRAIVTTDVPGCRDAIIPDETGLLVPAKDATALANAIQRLILDTELRQRMGKAGRQLAEERYDIRQVVKTHMNIYQELLDNA